jgi:hypothetical protein
MTGQENRVVRTECEDCGENMRQTKVMMWCHCGRLMSNNYGVFVEWP